MPSTSSLDYSFILHPLVNILLQLPAIFTPYAISNCNPNCGDQGYCLMQQPLPLLPMIGTVVVTALMLLAAARHFRSRWRDASVPWFACLVCSVCLGAGLFWKVYVAMLLLPPWPPSFFVSMLKRFFTLLIRALEALSPENPHDHEIHVQIT